MKLLITIFILITLSGCAAFHEKPLPPSKATDIQLQVVWVDSHLEIPRYIDGANGAAVFFDVDDKRYCTVYMVKPYGLNDFEGLKTLGHEILHCTDGRFHNPDFSNFGAYEKRMDRLR